MTRTGIKRWYLVHKWSSLVCTLFLLMLCITGLPLIFAEELEDALGHAPELAEVAPGTPRPSLDSIVAVALAARPGESLQYLFTEPGDPRVHVGTAPRPDSPFEQTYLQSFDGRTGTLLPPLPQREGFLYVMEELHIRMFAGLPGTLFLGAMGLLFLAAILSGIVLYAPFMRRHPFGAIRRDRSRRVKWLDLHNFLGIAIAAWLTVVTVTGVFNTLDLPIATQWRQTELADMTAPYRNAPPLRRLGSIDAAVHTAERASPGMEMAQISFPGTFFSTPHHYNVFMRGHSPVTSRLIKPSLIHAETAELTATRDMPFHIQALFVSRPFHFGDYGGLPLKIVWAILDILAIVVLGSGLYLWLGRRGARLERRVAEIVSGGAPEPEAPR